MSTNKQSIKTVSKPTDLHIRSALNSNRAPDVAVTWFRYETKISLLFRKSDLPVSLKEKLSEDYRKL
jgi:hypothetical protein